MAVVKVGGRDTALPDFNARKAIRAGRIMRDILEQSPQVQVELGRFRRDYERENIVELDRTSALVRFGPRPLVDDAGEPVRYPDGHPRAGEIVMAPGQLEHLSEADWQASGQKLRLPADPSREEMFLAIFPLLFDQAEDQVTQLLGLALVTEDDLGEAARAGGDENVRALLKRVGDDCLDRASLTEAADVLLTTVELIQEQVHDQSDDLRRRARPLMRLLQRLTGQQAPEDPAPTTPSSSEPKPASSTPSPTPTAGMSGPPSTELASSSSSS